MLFYVLWYRYRFSVLLAFTFRQNAQNLLLDAREVAVLFSLQKSARNDGGSLIRRGHLLAVKGQSVRCCSYSWQLGPRLNVVVCYNRRRCRPRWWRRNGSRSSCVRQQTQRIRRRQDCGRFSSALRRDRVGDCRSDGVRRCGGTALRGVEMMCTEMDMERVNKSDSVSTGSFLMTLQHR